jgi:hypothetical protein
MPDLSDFSAPDMIQCASHMRTSGSGRGSMEAVAQHLVDYLQGALTDSEGAVACPLVRLFKTHAFGKLSEELQTFAANLSTGSLSPDDRCLTLMASAGTEPTWSSRAASKGHQAIPLPSEAAIDQIPMISQLIRQLGVEIAHVVKPDPDVIFDLAQKRYSVFHVEHAKGSPYVPAQDFVEQFGIESVVGCGGILPSGELFSLILFSRVPISHDTAQLFEPLALSAKVALVPFSGSRVFSARGV